MKLKKAFSLVEILLVLAIIGVVTAAGLSIARHNAESAYNLYFYTGYVGLSDAIMDVAKNGHTINTDDNRQKFYKAVAKEFNTSYENDIIRAHNGITYQPRFVDEIRVAGTEICYKAVVFTMTISTINGSTQEEIAYIPSLNGGMILPTQRGMLQNRKDLLPFYINTGSGNFNGNREFLSYRDAYCRVYGPFPIQQQNSQPFIMFSKSDTCTSTPGVITPVNPRKVW